MTTTGERFAGALAARDEAGMRALLADEVDFEALTPGQHWQAATPGEVVGEIVFGPWFGPARIQELCSVSSGRVGGTEHVSYRLRVSRSGGEYLVEQQAYYRAEQSRITWMRVLCSGYQELREPDPLAV
jgi:hypothetical protein